MASKPDEHRKSKDKITNDEEYYKHVEKLKKKFEEDFNQNKLAESSDKLEDFKFMTILGQGAFGVVVSKFIEYSFLNFNN